MPDGRRLIFSSEAGGTVGGLFWQAADGSGSAEQLTQGPAVQRATAVMPDGRSVLFFAGEGIQVLTLDAARRTRPILRTVAGVGDGAVSPDGRWLAYVTREPGADSQVFVSPLAHPDQQRTLVSKAGGTQPRWAPDGREIFFIGPDGSLMSTPVRVDGELRAGVPERVLPRPYFNGLGVVARPATYDVAPDGQHFLMLQQATDANRPPQPATVVVVKNWAAQVRQLLSPR